MRISYRILIFSLLLFLTFFSVNAQRYNPGFAVLTQKNQTIFKKFFSGSPDFEKNQKINENTNFRMASVSKQFTAACIIILKNRGKLNYDDVLTNFFSEFKTGNKITIKHLLTHSSGLIDYENLIPDNQKDQISDAEVLDWVGKVDSLYFEPGSQFRYSNGGFCILSKIVEKVSGQSFSAFMVENIFKPLKMDNSYLFEKGSLMPNRAMGYAKNDTGEIIFSDQSITSATKGDGCVYTNLVDYQKWLSALTQRQLFDIQKELIEVNFPIPSQEGLFYGLGWFNISGKELYHTGSTCGFSNVVWQTIDGKNAVVFFSNLADNHAEAYPFFKSFKPSFKPEKVLHLTN
jgi:CubicO group peptidase (beta-lactamase class C family)